MPLDSSDTLAHIDELIEAKATSVFDPIQT